MAEIQAKGSQPRQILLAAGNGKGPSFGIFTDGKSSWIRGKDGWHDIDVLLDSMLKKKKTRAPRQRYATMKVKRVGSLAARLYSFGRYDLCQLQRADRLLTRTFGEWPAEMMRAFFVNEIESSKLPSNRLDYCLHLLLDIAGGLIACDRIPYDARVGLVRQLSRISAAEKDECDALLRKFFKRVLSIGAKYNMGCGEERVRKELAEVQERLISKAATGCSILREDSTDGVISPIIPAFLPSRDISAQRPGMKAGWLMAEIESTSPLSETRA